MKGMQRQLSPFREVFKHNITRPRFDEYCTYFQIDDKDKAAAELRERGYNVDYSRPRDDAHTPHKAELSEIGKIISAFKSAN